MTKYQHSSIISTADAVLNKKKTFNKSNNRSKSRKVYLISQSATQLAVNRQVDSVDVDEVEPCAGDTELQALGCISSISSNNGFLSN